MTKCNWSSEFEFFVGGLRFLVGESLVLGNPDGSFHHMRFSLAGGSEGCYEGA